ncbi:hypothetical protein RCL_jg26603.t1 [Rhizophagus clarus]|uniref:Uncharacterized protein n=1 Tax=Rhizophagus clarus TaxID=94130 RepID=A0A8H3QNY1_9GLOM|nr:hypothetical protein RCL_jg26603.t1 [Rhizophagus clarus]
MLCSVCEGHGTITQATAKDCTCCYGSGSILVSYKCQSCDSSGCESCTQGRVSGTKTCPSCDGSCQTIVYTKVTCPSCS